MKKTKKSVTMDDLAIMVAKGFSRTDEQFAKIDARFEKVDERFSGLESRLTTFETETRESFKKVRNDILDIGDKFVPRHEFDSFLTRFHRLEQKVEGKIGK